MTLYELNQSGYASLPNMSEEKIAETKTGIIHYLEKNKGTYYAMMCPDRVPISFTIFERGFYNTSDKEIANEMVSVAKTFGKIKSIEVNGDKIEFWIQEKDNICRMYAIFNYDQGVIRV